MTNGTERLPGRRSGSLRLATVSASVLAACALAGCSGGSTPDTRNPPSAPAGSSRSTAPTGSGSSSTTPAACPSGSYAVTKLQGQGELSALGTGTGGNLKANFSNGTWSLKSDGSQPMKLDVGITTADLRFSGDITGRYHGPADRLALNVTDASGTASIKGLMINQQRSLRQIAASLVPSGTTAAVSCTGNQATLTLPRAVLQLTRS